MVTFSPDFGPMTLELISLAAYADVLARMPNKTETSVNLIICILKLSKA
jgi:hypothetical protein